MKQMQNRAVGCVYGQFIGDALGSRYEFHDADETRKRMKDDQGNKSLLPLLGDGPFNYGPGVVTDDGEMAQSLLSSCIRMHCMDPSNVACSYARWRQSNPPDIGNTCSAALSFRAASLDSQAIEAVTKLKSANWIDTISPEQRLTIGGLVERNVREHNSPSLSNGSLMRQSVLAAFFSNDDDPATLFSAVHSDTLLTHCHNDAITASLVYARALRLLIRGATPEQTYDECLSQVESPLIRRILEDSKHKATPVVLSDLKTVTEGDKKAVGYLGVALQSAFYSLLHCSSFEEGVTEAVGRGGDTDTNGAIVAAMLGARFGVDGIPDEWKDSVSVAPMRMQGENGIESFEYLMEGIKKRYEKDSTV